MTAAYNTATAAITSQTGYPDGYKVGTASTDLVGFYGATPIVRPTTGTAVATTAATSTTPYGFTSSQANALIALANSLKANLDAVGLQG